VFLRVGLHAWAFIGIIGALAIVLAGLATISSIVLPLLFAVVLAVLFRPVAARIERRGASPTLASGAVVIGLLLVAVAVVAPTEHGIVAQVDRIADEIEAALIELDVDQQSIDDIRQSLEDLSPTVVAGFIEAAVSGISAIGGFAVGVILGVLIMYYLVKDGPRLRQTAVDRLPPAYGRELDAFVGESCFVLRRYWLGRTIVSAIVASVVGVAALILGLPLVLTLVMVTFVGGYVPYIGAFVGGFLAVAVALGSSGVPAAIAMLVVVLVANLLIENLVEPAITGRTLQIHPLVVLLVTTAGGIVGGLVGLVMAVPITVITVKAIGHLREVVDVDADALRDTIRRRVDLHDDPPPAPTT
jgi:predicted PurR-regulated permease PerM